MVGQLKNSSLSECNKPIISDNSQFTIKHLRQSAVSESQTDQAGVISVKLKVLTVCELITQFFKINGKIFLFP